MKEVEILKKIVSEFSRIRELETPVIEKTAGSLSMPLYLYSGDGRREVSSRLLYDLLHQYCLKLWANRPAIAAVITEKEFASLATHTVAKSLFDTHEREATDDRQRNIKQAINELIDNSISTEHYFGCQLFADKLQGNLTIGSVLLEHREQWLERKLGEGFICEKIYEEVQSIWHHGKAKNATSNSYEIRTNDINRIIGDHSYVCSVKTIGFSNSQGIQRALKSARIAIFALCLRYNLPSDGVRGMYLACDAGVDRISFLSHSEKGIRTESRILKFPYDTTFTASEWKKLVVDWDDLYNPIGKVLNHYTNIQVIDGFEEIFRCFYQALTWMFEGTIEGDDHMAVTKFASCLDTLAKGGKSKGIKKLSSARLGQEADTLIFDGTETLGGFIDKIYNHTRSRSLHGSYDKIGYDINRLRSQAEIFTRNCLITCLVFYHDNPHIEEVEDLSKI